MSAPPAPALLVIDDLAVAYADGGRVLEHLALELAQGEIGCIVGSSGSGNGSGTGNSSGSGSGSGRGKDKP